MLDNELDRAILAVRYMRDKITECSFTVVDGMPRDSTYVTEELNLDTKVNSATEKQWHCTKKTMLTLDFANSSVLPEDFPSAKAPELAEKGGFLKLFASKCSNFGKELAEGAPAYLDVRFDFKAIFDFMIGEKEKFNVKKITVMVDWDYEGHSHRCWRFGLIYNGRYIPATSIQGDDEGFQMVIKASNDFSKLVNPPRASWNRPADNSHLIPVEGNAVEGFTLSVDFYTNDSLPFFNEILSLAK